MKNLLIVLFILTLSLQSVDALIENTTEDSQLSDEIIKYITIAIIICAILAIFMIILILIILDKDRINK